MKSDHNVVAGSTRLFSEALQSAAARLAPIIRRKQVPMGSCAPEEKKAEFHKRWEEREDTRTRPRATLNDSGSTVSLTVATEQPRRARGRKVRRGSSNNMSANSKRVFEKTTRLASRSTTRGWSRKGRGRLLRSTSRTSNGDCCGTFGLIREHRVGWFHKLLHAKSPTLDPTIVNELKVRPPPHACRWATTRLGTRRTKRSGR